MYLLELLKWPKLACMTSVDPSLVIRQTEQLENKTENQKSSDNELKLIDICGGQIVSLSNGHFQASLHRVALISCYATNHEIRLLLRAFRFMTYTGFLFEKTYEMNPFDKAATGLNCWLPGDSAHLVG